MLNENNHIKIMDMELKPQNVESSNGVVEIVKIEDLGSKKQVFKESEDDNLPPIPDGGFGWVVVGSVFFVSVGTGGLIYSFGLLHEEFTRYFETTQSKTAVVGSLFTSIPFLIGPLMSALVDHFGCKKTTIFAGIISAMGFILSAFSNSVEMLCITFGVISGAATGVLYVTSIVPITLWFDKKRNFAVSIASCGFGVGTVIFSPITSFFLSIYDWRNTLVMLSGTFLNMCVCAMLMRNPDWFIIKQKREHKLKRQQNENSFYIKGEQNRLLENGNTTDVEMNSTQTGNKSENENTCCQQLVKVLKNSFDITLFNELHFLIFFLATLVLSIWFIVPYFFLKSYVTEVNMEGGPLMISTIGIANIIGILALGWLGDFPRINVNIAYAVCLVISGASVAMYPVFIHSFWGSIAVSAIFGLSCSSAYPYTPTILLQLVPLERFTVAYGILLLSVGAGHLIGPPLGGLLYDVTGNWEMTFYMGGLWLAVSGLMIALLAYTKNVQIIGTTSTTTPANVIEINKNH